MYEFKECPYCKAKNEINISDWGRVRCPECKGVYMANVVCEIQVTKFPDNGKDVDHTHEG